MGLLLWGFVLTKESSAPPYDVSCLPNRDTQARNGPTMSAAYSCPGRGRRNNTSAPYFAAAKYARRPTPGQVPVGPWPLAAPDRRHGQRLMLGRGPSAPNRPRAWPASPDGLAPPMADVEDVEQEVERLTEPDHLKTVESGDPDRNLSVRRRRFRTRWSDSRRSSTARAPQIVFNPERAFEIFVLDRPVDGSG